jgi:hypothetical protein
VKVLRGCAIAASVPAPLFDGLLVLLGREGGTGELSARQVAGVWKGSGGARVEFDDDGTFEMSGVPRSAIVFSFTDPPPGKGRLSGTGRWSLYGNDGSSGTIELHTVLAGFSSADSVIGLLQVQDAGDHPSLYFDTDVDKKYGFEIHRETAP